MSKLNKVERIRKFMVGKDYMTASEIHIGVNQKDISKKFVSGFLANSTIDGTVKFMKHLVECPVTKRAVKDYKLTAKAEKDYSSIGEKPEAKPATEAKPEAKPEASKESTIEQQAKAIVDQVVKNMLNNAFSEIMKKFA